MLDSGYVSNKGMTKFTHENNLKSRGEKERESLS
jgi:hypothetical protein